MAVMIDSIMSPKRNRGSDLKDQATTKLVLSILVMLTCMTVLSSCSYSKWRYVLVEETGGAEGKVIDLDDGKSLHVLVSRCPKGNWEITESGIETKEVSGAEDYYFTIGIALIQSDTSESNRLRLAADSMRVTASGLSKHNYLRIIEESQANEYISTDSGRQMFNVHRSCYGQLVLSGNSQPDTIRVHSKVILERLVDRVAIDTVNLQLVALLAEKRTSRILDFLFGK